MADERLLSQLTVDGYTYTIKDAGARSTLDTMGKTLTVTDSRVFSTDVTYNGKSNVSLDLSGYMVDGTKTATPYPLTFTGGSTVSYDGSAAKSVAIPTSLKNPKAITFKGGATGTYDGSSAVTVNIPTTTTYTLTGTYDSTLETLELSLT